MKGRRVAYVIVILALIFVATQGSQSLTFGVIFPHTTRKTLKREYNKTVYDHVKTFSQILNREGETSGRGEYITLDDPSIAFLKTSTPLDILDDLCEELFRKNILAILYFTHGGGYSTNAASSQFLLQVTEYIGIPVIAWNAGNIGVHKGVTESNALHLTPSIDHQVSALLSILKRYSWHRFSVVTSQINGHDDFVRAIRAQVVHSTDFQFTIIDIFLLKRVATSNVSKELENLAKSEARIVLLYCNREEAKHIMVAAKKLNITGENYVWLVTQSILGTIDIDKINFTSFPSGMLGVGFNGTGVQAQIVRAVAVFCYGFYAYLNDPRNSNVTLSPNIDCTASGPPKWNKGLHFFKYLRNVNISNRLIQNLTFNKDGTLKYAEIDIMNLNKEKLWDKVGTWTMKGLFIKDIVWPGNATKPPAGVPEKFNLKVTFMEEPPYITAEPPENGTGECKTERAVRCRTNLDVDKSGTDGNNGTANYMCCAGFCIDLLQKFANDLGFTYDLYQVEDGKWGALHNGTWNGLIAELLKRKADIVVTSIKINSERQSAVDFTVPFLETGIAIVVAKRTGIISPKAFLEPFDTISWIMILFICIQVSAFAIFLFEWLSPSGYNMKSMPPRDHKFSLFRAYWLVWAILFGAAVNVDCPRGYTARFMSNVWAMFAVVFLAIYTANLAAFMITREEYYNLSGIEDKRLQYPNMMEPPFRYGTIPHGNTETVLKRNKIELYRYMKKHNRPSVKEGIRAVKTGELDAFIYDSTVLEFWVGQDNECRLLTVGSWYAMTGYGFALPKKSKYLDMFNRQMIRYRENGDLERLQRFWFQGACKPTKSKRNVSKPLDINQFMSAFLLLGCGVLLTIFLLGLEHLYYRYVRKHLPKKDKGGCFTLISLSVGKSLSFRGAVFEAQDMLKQHRCKDPVCDTQLWKAKHELDMAQLKIRSLEAQIEGRSPDENYFHSRRTGKKSASSNELFARAPPRYQAFCKTPSATDVDEIETVL